MVYGDLQIFDILIFLGIAVFLIYRLRNVLGKRTGFEGPKNTTEIKNTKNEDTKKFAPELKDNETKLSVAYETLSDFDHRKFLESAKFAFETIINAFNEGDKKTLKNLLTKEAFLSFEQAIDNQDNNPNFQFYSLVVDAVEDVIAEKETINITLKFTSEQFRDNDESTIIKKQDVWTFQKKINSRSQNWFLSST
jgi:predicted lipid-binding transport protein (Tim44 family)